MIFWEVSCDFLIIFELASALRKLKPDILHTHSSKAGIVGRMAGWLAQVPVVIHTYHGFGFNHRQKPWTRGVFVFLEKWVSRLSTKLIFVSKSNQLEAAQKGIGRREQYLLFRSGVPLKIIIDEAKNTNKIRFKNELHLKENNRIVLTIGAFKPQKNLGDFIDLVNHVSSQMVNVDFLVVGDGEMRPEIEKKIKGAGLESRVRLLGWRRDVPALLSIADVFVLTSLWEGLPRSLVEALAVGVPCVCYATDGVTDLLQTDTRMLISQGDVESLTRAVLKILGDKIGAASLVQEHQKFIGREFDIDYMVKQQGELYIKLLKTSQT